MDRQLYRDSMIQGKIVKLKNSSIMILEKDLQTAYSQDWESLGIVMNEINADIQTPFLLSVARGEGDDADESWWTEADIRVMFFGKEANQWKNEDT